MLCAGWCFPGWKPVVPEENLSGFRSATSKGHILFLCKALGLAAPCQEAPPLQKVFKLLWLLVWQTWPAPEKIIICSLPAGHFGTQPDNAA